MLIGRFNLVLLRTAILLFSFQKGLDWHSREAVSSQAAAKWHIHLNELFYIMCKFHHLICARILFPFRFRDIRKSYHLQNDFMSPVWLYVSSMILCLQHIQPFFRQHLCNQAQ